jgi:hypothetical protein
MITDAVESADPELPLRARVVWWAFAFALGLLLTALLTLPHPWIISALPAFPQGLFFFLPAVPAPAALGWPVASGWLIYATLTILLFGAVRRRRYAILMTIFCTLLVLNAFGCKKQFDGAEPLMISATLDAAGAL